MTQPKRRMWEKPEPKPSLLHDEPPVAACPSITVNDLRGYDALLERLLKVHGEKEE